MYLCITNICKINNSAIRYWCEPSLVYEVRWVRLEILVYAISVIRLLCMIYGIDTEPCATSGSQEFTRTHDSPRTDRLISIVTTSCLPLTCEFTR